MFVGCIQFYRPRLIPLETVNECLTGVNKQGANFLWCHNFRGLNIFFVAYSDESRYNR